MSKSLHVLVCPTAFKGSLSPNTAARLVASTLSRNRPQWNVKQLPLADGGDGTLNVLASALKLKKKFTWVTGPLRKKVRAEWGITFHAPPLAGKTAVIEMANASGLKYVKGKKKPLEASSIGTGELIRAALQSGCKNILIGVGGAASSDGGAGALQALGLKYEDKQGTSLRPHPLDLMRLERIRWEEFDPRVKKTKIFVLCDVKTTLSGPHGSARTFAPQKGATPHQVLLIERFLKRWSTFAKFNRKNRPGSGAAGALAFGLAAFTGAQLVEGASFILNMVRFKKESEAVDIIITGEGKLDVTSFQGKIIGAVALNKRKARVYVLCGTAPLSKHFLKQHGIEEIVQMGAAGIKNPSAAIKEATTALIKKINL